jgi:hypothetical protein
MGQYSSPAPPPPPDYTKEKKQVRLDTEKAYKKKADAYNKEVDAYNAQLTDFNKKYGSFSNTIGGLDMSSFWDDPTTAQNENMYGSYLKDLTNLKNSLGGLNFNTDKPIFDSSIDSEYGTVSITNIPTLSKINSNLYNTLTGGFDSLIGDLKGLNTDRTNEIQRINDFRQGILGNIEDYNVGLGQMGIADLNQMNALERNLQSLNRQRQGFTSALMGQLYPNGFEQFDSLYSGVNQGLTDLRGQRTAEEKRISDYEKAILGYADEYGGMLSNYDITNADEMNALQKLIDARQKEAGRFSSELGFDFSQELADLYDVETGLGKLQGDRTKELNRIQQAQNDYLASARAIEQAAEGGSIYSKAGLDAIGDRIRDLNQDIGGFSSLLNYDFSNTNSAIADASTALAGLNEKRQSELDKILAGITGQTEGLSGIDLYNQDEFDTRRQALKDLELQLSPFSGGRVNEIQTSLDTGVGQIDTKLKELADYRNNLEQRAQTLMETVNNASYYATGDLSGSQSDYDAIQAEAELYNAQQAMDEIDAIMGRLNSERQRLEVDAENVDARQLAATEDLNVNPLSGLPQFQNLSQIDPMTFEEFYQLYGNPNEEEALAAYINSPFSQNVINAGS